MDRNIPKQYSPLTETAFYILMALRQERHGYDIMQWARAITGGEVELNAGTVYNCLSRMERDSVVECSREDSRRKFYRLTKLGNEILETERHRLARAYHNSKGLMWEGGSEHE